MDDAKVIGPAMLSDVLIGVAVTTVSVSRKCRKESNHIPRVTPFAEHDERHFLSWPAPLRHVGGPVIVES